MFLTYNLKKIISIREKAEKFNKILLVKKWINLRSQIFYISISYPFLSGGIIYDVCFFKIWDLNMKMYWL